MKTLMIGLGGTGTEVVMRLQDILDKKLENAKDDEKAYETLKKRFGNVRSLIVDTDRRGAVQVAARKGIASVYIGTSGIMEDFINILGEDVTSWCPNTSDEQVFLASDLNTGAGQCRLKSRLALAMYLKNDNNELAKELENLRMATPELTEQNPRIMIVSSIAGGTGSGIFIQIALYIKKYFKEKFNAAIDITGLFACPDLYIPLLDNDEQIESVKANGYAVIRELNALNIIYSNTATSDYGKNIDMRISTKCEGNLFESDVKGKYAYKPYDLLYFIDRVSNIGAINRGDKSFYDKMANIAYARMFSELSESVLSTEESNEMRTKSIAPLAIYGSAGSAKLLYPHEDVLDYFASRFAMETISEKWTLFDDMWHEKLKEREQLSLLHGSRVIEVEPNERQNHYINEFVRAVYPSGMTTDFQFDYLKVGYTVSDGRSGIKANLPVKIPVFLNQVIPNLAKSTIKEDSRLNTVKYATGINDEAIDNTVLEIVASLKESQSGEGEFEGIEAIDRGIREYGRTCITRASAIAQTVSSIVLCTSENLWNSFDKKNGSLVKNLLQDDNGKFLHPLAIRYILYCLRNELENEIKRKSSDKGFEDIIMDSVRTHELMLDNNPEDDNDIYTDKELDELIDKRRGWKKAAVILNEIYIDDAKNTIAKIEGTLVNAVVTACKRELAQKLDIIIEQYESFFDNIEQYSSELIRNLNRSDFEYDDDGELVVKIGSTKNTNDVMFRRIAGGFDTQTGRTMTVISEGLFDTVRKMSWGESRKINGSDYVKQIKNTIKAELVNNADVRQILDREIFSAILDEYDAINGTENRINFNKDNAARENVMNFLENEFKNLVVRSQPSLLYDSAEVFRTGNQKRVNKNYRHILISKRTAEAIHELYPLKATPKDAVESFFSEISPSMPKDSNKNTITLIPVIGEFENSREIFCFSAVHCLQPYQIDHFDELNNGDYYSSYKSRLALIAKTGVLSHTPHLDKTWHLHGKMPYVNVEKELDTRVSLIKAFLYALIYGKITIVQGRNAPSFYIQDPENNLNEPIFYASSLAGINDYAKVLYWLGNREDIVEIYAARFDFNMKFESETLAACFRNVKDAETNMTSDPLIARLREDLIETGFNRSMDGSAGVNSKKAIDKVGVLEVACKLKENEERIVDFDYAEALLKVVATTIDEFCKQNFNQERLGIPGTTESTEYCHMKLHNAQKFMEQYVNTKKQQTQKKRQDEDGTMPPADTEASEIISGKISRPLDHSANGDSLVTSEQFNIKAPDYIAGSEEFKWLEANFVNKLVN